MMKAKNHEKAMGKMMKETAKVGGKSYGKKVKKK